MKKALFLDRDGVINIQHEDYSHQEKFEYVNGIFELCRHFLNIGYLIVVVTNQGGIAFGKLTEESLMLTHKKMVNDFFKEGIKITEVFYCPYHPKGFGKYKMEHIDRKPGPGMILKASEKYNINLSESIMVGNYYTDVEAGKNAGCGINILVQTNSDNIYHEVLEKLEL